MSSILVGNEGVDFPIQFSGSKNCPAQSFEFFIWSSKDLTQFAVIECVDLELLYDFSESIEN